MSDYNKDDTIEDGDYVRVIDVDPALDWITSIHSTFLGCDGVVTETDSSSDDSRVTFPEGVSLWFKDSWLEIMSPAGSKEPFIDWEEEDTKGPDHEAQLEQAEFQNRAEQEAMAEIMADKEEYENAKEDLWALWEGVGEFPSAKKCKTLGSISSYIVFKAKRYNT